MRDGENRSRRTNGRRRIIKGRQKRKTRRRTKRRTRRKKMEKDELGVSREAGGRRGRSRY